MDRIWFPGSPWPDGHRIAEFAWNGRLDHDGNLWFNIELTTAPYAENPPSDSVVETDRWTSLWRWYEYERCWLTSYGLGDLLAGTPGNPFRLTRPHRLTADPLPLPRPGADLTWFIHVLGHDSSADHDLTFTPEPTGTGHRIDWTAKVALTYLGEEEFSHDFRILLRNRVPGRITFPDDVPIARAREQLAEVVDVPDLFVPQEGDGSPKLVFTPHAGK
ncbi:hypothetical protein ACIGNX_29580 [Actinosynnema sp. NPDC053489]|uniref:hypothetical protein n=1 Tax=Actinosynnema sp. NPDC053489 TaxID=3363916 RepID=UPI0037CC2671